MTETYCAEHDLPELVVHTNGDPWEIGCPICNYENYQSKRNGLKNVSGIGKKTEEKLREVGITNTEELKSADPEEVAMSIDGISESRIREWQASV